MADDDVRSVISHTSDASQTYNEVKDLLNGIFKQSEQPVRSRDRDGINYRNDGDDEPSRPSYTNEFTSSIREVTPSVRLESISPRKPDNLDRLLAAQ